MVGIRYGLFAALLIALSCAPTPETAPSESTASERLRVMTFNLEDVRTADLLDPEQARVRRLAAIIQELRPDILLINEIAYDQAGAPDVADGSGEGRNGQRFADAFLAVSQGEGLEPLAFRAFMAPSNTGIASGFDLDNDGEAVGEFPPPPPSGEDGSPGRQTAEGRRYGNDSFGFGTFPGQYAMALLVRSDLEILEDQVRTFRLLSWAAVPGARLPVNPDSDEPWYADDEAAAFRLSSKSHWDVPVRLANGRVLHVLASHPTPPAFDGPEQRNVRRNHDEIRLLADHIAGADYLRDDAGGEGGLPDGASFVVVGDLNADPEAGASLDNPIGSLLFALERLNGTVTPLATVDIEGLKPTATSGFGLRVDYVLPSTDLEVVDAGVWRGPAGGAENGAVPSDHFPVWMDLVAPPP